MLIKDLEETASVRLYNCLVKKFGENKDLAFTREDIQSLLNFRNFGLKSLTELGTILGFNCKDY